MAVEEISLGKELRHKRDPETGLPLEHEPPEWNEITEVRATGRDVRALLGGMKDEAQREQHWAENLRRKVGVELLRSPDGKLTKIPGPLVETYRDRGFGRARVRPGIAVSGFGGMQREGLTRLVIRYSGGERTVVKEERK